MVDFIDSDFKKHLDAIGDKAVEVMGEAIERALGWLGGIAGSVKNGAATMAANHSHQTSSKESVQTPAIPNSKKHEITPPQQTLVLSKEVAAQATAAAKPLHDHQHQHSHGHAKEAFSVDMDQVVAMATPSSGRMAQQQMAIG